MLTVSSFLLGGLELFLLRRSRMWSERLGLFAMLLICFTMILLFTLVRQVLATSTNSSVTLEPMPILLIAR